MKIPAPQYVSKLLSLEGNEDSTLMDVLHFIAKKDLPVGTRYRIMDAGEVPVRGKQRSYKALKSGIEYMVGAV